jgi:hypothetical protein
VFDFAEQNSNHSIFYESNAPISFSDWVFLLKSHKHPLRSDKRGDLNLLSKIQITPFVTSPQCFTASPKT